MNKNTILFCHQGLCLDWWARFAIILIQNRILRHAKCAQSEGAPIFSEATITRDSRPLWAIKYTHRITYIKQQ